jgi:hypothetical protein
MSIKSLLAKWQRQRRKAQSRNCRADIYYTRGFCDALEKIIEGKLK